MADRALTVAEAAERLGTHKQSVYRLIWARELDAVDISRKGARRPRLRVRESALDGYLDRSAVA